MKSAELKALEALEIAKELRASLTEMSGTEISPQVSFYFGCWLMQSLRIITCITFHHLG